MEIIEEFIESIGKIVVFIMILLSVFLFTVSTKNKLSNRLFGMYLLVIAFDLIGFFTNKTFDYPNLHILKTSSSLLQLPLFYLYVLSACYINFRITIKHIIHALLFVFFLFLFKITKFSNQSYSLFEVIGEIQYFAYIIAIFIVLKKYKTVYLENYSKANYAVYKWLFQITLFSCFAHSFVIVRWYLSSSKYTSYILNINFIISISVLLITVFFVLKALYQPELFTGVNINLEPIKSSIKKNVNQKNIQKNGLENEYLKKLTSFMEENKPYLDFELTLQKLALQTDIPEKELSLLINHYLGKHFFDFINEYRINEAKVILANPDEMEVTILEILYQVGFNSKSTFYAAFKKVTNKTPTQYRKEAFSLKN